METTTFVKDWLCSNAILGEGSYGEVRLLIHKHTGEKLACKIMDHSKFKDSKATISREVMIHKMLNHENIIKFFGRREEPDREYVFLEYAAGGELFQMIEPDLGMPSHNVHTFMNHLLSGVSYLHDKGVAHRDIKPENLLIDRNGILKISDFGMATLFRLKGKERKLDKKCGTKPYLAPEVLKRPYFARPADLWSCAIVFVAMLTGELPWSGPTENSEEFVKWCNDDYISESPWSKLGNAALSLARQMLHEDPMKRLTLEQILKHPWMKMNFRHNTITDQVDSSTLNPTKRWNSMIETETKRNRETPQITLSQPAMAYPSRPIDELIKNITTNRKRDTHVCFSQPTRNDDVILHFTPVTKENFNNLVKRMTRFYVSCDFKEAIEYLGSVLDSLHYSWSLDAAGIVTITTVDNMKNQLIFKANLLEMDGHILMDFRLFKGCGLEFKKKFSKLKSCLASIVDDKNLENGEEKE